LPLGERADGDVLVARNASNGGPVIALRRAVADVRAAADRIAEARDTAQVIEKIDRGHREVTVTHVRYTVPRQPDARPPEDAVVAFVEVLDAVAGDVQAKRLENNTDRAARIAADLAGHVARGPYAHFEVIGHDGDVGEILVTCPYGKQGPLKRLGAHFDRACKAWRVPGDRFGELKKALDRAVTRAQKEQAAEADKRARATARWCDGDGLGFKPVHVTVHLSGERIVVAFPYNRKAVELVKTITGARFHRDDKTWSVPVTELDRLREVASEIDAIISAAESARVEQQRLRAEEAKLERAQERERAAAERARAAERKAEWRREKGIKLQYRPSRSQWDSSLGELVWIDDWPHRVVGERKNFFEEGTMSIHLTGLPLTDDPIWAICMDCEPLPEAQARPMIEQWEAREAEARRRIDIWDAFVARLKDGTWTVEGDDRPVMAPYSGKRPPADAVYLRFKVDEGGSRTVTVDPDRCLLFLSRPIWDGDVWTETLSSPLQAGDRALLDRTRAEFGDGTSGHLAVPTPSEFKIVYAARWRETQAKSA
jgi:hypothetical protein